MKSKIKKILLPALIYVGGGLIAAALIFAGVEKRGVLDDTPVLDLPVPDVKLFFTRSREDGLPVEQLPPPDMTRMKTEGCVADGLLSGYGRTSKELKVINNSECYYLHRAIETWREAPDFDDIRKIKSKITKPDLVFGMFIAEALSTKEDYKFYAENREFDFKDMCRKSSKNFWGEHTCKPSFKRSEYRAYVKQITEEAMDNGVQVFMFGQIFFQDNINEPRAPEILAEMRGYADEIGLDILIGAQTNDIRDEQYLRHFDFIEGGVGLRRDGTIESGPCFSRWYQEPGDWCWALMWHPDFKDIANNVLVHLDWSGKIGDDMSTFARMNKNLRHNTLKNLHTELTNQDVGFLLPVLAPLPGNNGGCHGPKKKFYSPSDKYGCHDEDEINTIIKNARQ